VIDLDQDLDRRVEIDIPHHHHLPHRKDVHLVTVQSRVHRQELELTILWSERTSGDQALGLTISGEEDDSTAQQRVEEVDVEEEVVDEVVIEEEKVPGLNPLL
jgi:hypothetical protein